MFIVDRERNKKKGLNWILSPLGVFLLPSLRVVIRRSAYLDQAILFAPISKSDHASFKMGGLRVDAPCSVLSSLALSLQCSISPRGPLIQPLLASSTGSFLNTLTVTFPIAGFYYKEISKATRGVRGRSHFVSLQTFVKL